MFAAAVLVSFRKDCGAVCSSVKYKRQKEGTQLCAKAPNCRKCRLFEVVDLSICGILSMRVVGHTKVL